VEVIVAPGPTATRAARAATPTIPIVMGTNDPVEQGLIASLAKPGGNVTGWCVLSADAAEKQLSMLKEAMPRLGRAAVLMNPGWRATGSRTDQFLAAARAIGVEVATHRGRRTRCPRRRVRRDAQGTGSTASWSCPIRGWMP
jgi:putative ABC transport system substrate-binding protein